MMKRKVLFLISLTHFYSVAYSLSDTLNCNTKIIDSLNTCEHKVSTDSSSIEKDNEDKKHRTVGFIITFSLIGTTLGLVLYTLLLKAIENMEGNGRGIMVDG